MSIEVEDFVNAKTVERAHGWAADQQRLRRYHHIETAMRAARDRNGRLLVALDRGAEVMRALSGQQLGESHTHAGLRVDATEAALWREAYVSADRGSPMDQFRWIYVAAARLAGIL